jgi:hypothetical protein
MSEQFLCAVEVGAWDIAEGQKGSCQDCPVALALLRALRLQGRDVAEVQVNGVSIVFWERRGPDLATFIAVTHPNLTDWIRDFDQNRPVYPFTVTLEFEREEYGRAVA